ncbi:MAG: hypothetical protein RSE36_00855, partial [Oscillospiraceae bacterium]
ESVLWILFMIPGTPKDLFTYLGPFVPVKAWKFFVIATFARIPGILTSTIAGQSFYEGEWWKIVFVFVITGLFGLLGIYLNNRIVKNKKKSGASKEAELCVDEVVDVPQTDSATVDADDKLDNSNDKEPGKL